MTPGQRGGGANHGGAASPGAESPAGGAFTGKPDSTPHSTSTAAGKPDLASPDGCSDIRGAGSQMQPDPVRRFSYDEIVGVVPRGSTVLDLGCGDGELLARLRDERGAHGRGVDIEEDMIRCCIARGISVFQGDLDEGLKDYPSQSYDFVILNKTLQVVHKPVLLLQEMLRVGRRVIVSFPNFAFILNRIQLALMGRMPVTRTLPYEWYNTPNIHLCTRKDFLRLGRRLGFTPREEICLTRGVRIPPIAANLLAEEICYVLDGSGQA